MTYLGECGHLPRDKTSVDRALGRKGMRPGHKGVLGKDQWDCTSAHRACASIASTMWQMTSSLRAELWLAKLQSAAQPSSWISCRSRCSVMALRMDPRPSEASVGPESAVSGE